MAKFNKKKYVDEKGRLKNLGAFVDWLIEEHNICLINGNLYMYRADEGIYVKGSEEISCLVDTYFPDATPHQMADIATKVRVRVQNKRLIKSTEPYKHLIVFKNGVFNINTWKLGPYSKDYIKINRIPHNLNFDAYCEAVDTFLDKFTDDDIEKRFQVEEAVGYGFIDELPYDKLIIFVGVSASNGKSTLQNVIKAAYGPENCTCADLRKICDEKDTYTKAAMYGKMINIGYDISDQYIPDASALKVITSGETVEAREIYGKPFYYEPTTVQLYSSNGIPKIKDIDNGVLRRLLLIECAHKFSPSDPDFDPRFESKIVNSEDAMEYFIAIAMGGLLRLIQQGGFTESERSKALLEEYKKDCNPALGWAEEFLEIWKTFDGMKREFAYNEYRNWAEKAGNKPMSQNVFVRFINNNFNMKVEPKYDADLGTTVRKFVSA